MAQKKWPKWLAGIASVGAFTGFLYLTQTNDVSALPSDDKDPRGADSNRLTAGLDSTLLQAPPVSGNEEKVQVRTFLHSREEMRQIAALSPEAKAEREKILQQLNWDDTTGAVATVQTGINYTQINANAAPATPPQHTKSDRKTRRS